MRVDRTQTWKERLRGHANPVLFLSALTQTPPPPPASERSEAATSPAPSPRQAVLLLSASAEGHVRQWNITLRNVVRKFDLVIHPPLKPYSATLDELRGCVAEERKSYSCFDCSQNHDELIAGTTDGTVAEWNTRTEQFVRAYYGHEAAVTGVELGIGCDSVVTSSVDMSVRVWNRSCGECSYIFKHEVPVGGIVFLTPTFIASAAWDGTCRLIHLAEAVVKGTLTLRSRALCLCLGEQKNSFAATDSHRPLFIGASDGSIAKWNTKDTKAELQWCAHTAAVLVVRALKDRLYSIAEDGTLKTWDTQSGLQLSYVSSVDGFESALAVSDSCAFTASTNFYIVIWDLFEQEERIRETQSMRWEDLQSRMRDIAEASAGKKKKGGKKKGAGGKKKEKSGASSTAAGKKKKTSKPKKGKK